MPSLQLDIDEQELRFVLKGDVSSIVQNYRARHYFGDVLGASFLEDTALVPYEHERREDILRKLHEALRRFGIEHIDAGSIRQILNAYYTERDRFAQFSEKAKGIWHNRIDEKEFRAFKESVERSVVRRVLYDRQLLAAFHLAFSQNACDFSVPGSGKTSTVYAAYSYLSHLPPDDPKSVNKLLVIGPLSSFGPWEDEFLQCFGRVPNSIRLSGGMPRQERDRHLLSIRPVEETPELTLMSYQSVGYNLDSLVYFLQRGGNRVMVVLDEAHRIKNVEGGVWAHAALSLSRHCASRVVLTGTPLPNGYEDLQNLFEFIWPGKDLVKYSVYQLKDMSANRYDSRIPQLIENVSPFFVRIRKSHLMLPPAVSHEPVYVEMDPLQDDIYRYVENRYLSYLVTGRGLSLRAELTRARVVRLMQAATNPALLRQPLEDYFRAQGLGDELDIDDAEIIRKIFNYSDLTDAPPKFRAVRDIVADLVAEGEKVVIWGVFIHNIRSLQLYLARSGIESELLIGEVPVERDDVSMDDIVTREKVIRTFHDPDSPFRVLIANPHAVSESISLHKACHNAIYLERTFNATHFIQSKDRIHRVGLDPQTTTHYQFILTRDSIDEVIHNRLAEKEARMLEVIEGQEIPLFSENMDYDVDTDSDIKALIRDYVGRASRV